MNLQGYVKDLKILFQGECIGSTRGENFFEESCLWDS